MLVQCVPQAFLANLLKRCLTPSNLFIPQDGLQLHHDQCVASDAFVPLSSLQLRSQKAIATLQDYSSVKRHLQVAQC